jgi:hypothetical protein
MSDLGSILGNVLKNYGSVPQSPNDVQDVSHNEVYNHYQQYAQQAPPQQVYQAHQQAYQHLPPDQQQAIYNDVMKVLQQHGINPQQVGVQPNQPTPQNFAKTGQYISQQPDLLHKILGPGGALSSPIAKMVLAGALAMAGNQLSRRGL